MERTLISELQTKKGEEVVINGWVSVRRDQGKLAFFDFRDRTGMVQGVVFGKPEVLEQIIKQLEKLIDVVKAIDHTGQPVIDTEIALVKVEVELKDRTSLLQMTEHYHGKVVDYASDSVVIRIAGTSDKLNSFIDLLQQWKILELVRSGKIVMARGSDET